MWILVLFLQVQREKKETPLVFLDDDIKLTY